MIHQPLGGAAGQAADIEIQVGEEPSRSFVAYVYFFVLVRPFICRSFSPHTVLTRSVMTALVRERGNGG